MAGERASIAGYGENAEALAADYESVSFERLHRDLLPLVPPACRVLDIGAGSGRDAAALARLGHHVVAVEPTVEFRALGRRLHAGERIEWVDDALPELAAMQARDERFDVVLLTAVWMHLDVTERRRAMPRVAALMAPGAVMQMSLRHGPVPPGRRMFAVTAEETGHLGEAAGLSLLLQRERDDMHGRASVTWSFLIFRRPTA